MCARLCGILITAAGWHDEDPGGANRLPTDFARYLALRDRYVAYLCPAEHSSSSNPEIIDGVEVWRYTAPKATSPSLVNLLAHLNCSRRTAGLIRERHRIAAVLGHAPLQYLGALAGAGAGTRKCYAVHSPFVEEWKSNLQLNSKLRKRLALPIVARMESRIFGKSDLIHCDSAYCLELIRAEYPGQIGEKGIVLSGWVDTQRFTPAAESRNQLRRRLGAPWNSTTNIFFTLRRLVPRMGLDTLLEATAIVARDGYAFKLVIGGDGPERQPLEAQVQRENLADRVVFLGRIPEDRLVDCFRAANCFVLPTRALECFGLIVLEAYACGIPVVGVPVGAIPEVMGVQLSAWVAQDNSAPALADKMRDFLRSRLAVSPEQLRDRALQFSLGTMARKHEQALFGNRT